MGSVSSIVARCSLIAGAIAAAVYALLLARAEALFNRDTAISVPAAVRLVPYDSAYLARLAAWRPAEHVALLQRAVSYNPFDFESWIQLGLASEFQQGDVSAAERYFLKAAAVNRMFLPRWTLTNFYFRHNKLPEFFRWAKATLAITPYSPEPVFLQMWQISQDGGRIAAAVPERPRALLPYAWFLSNSNRNSLVSPILDRLITAIGNRDPRSWGRDDLVATMEDRLLAAGQQQPALDVWKRMVNARWLNETVPSPQHPLTNGNFRQPFFRHGFDWMPVNAEGVRVDQYADQGSLNLRFSGDESERCLLLQQYVPLAAGRPYRLGWRIKANTLTGLSGLTWHLRPVSPAAPAGSLSDEFQSSDLLSPSPAGWQFRSPPQTSLGLLTLQYARPLGQTVARGSLVLQAVSLSTE